LEAPQNGPGFCGFIFEPAAVYQGAAGGEGVADRHRPAVWMGVADHLIHAVSEVHLIPDFFVAYQDVAGLAEQQTGHAVVGKADCSGVQAGIADFQAGFAFRVVERLFCSAQKRYEVPVPAVRFADELRVVVRVVDWVEHDGTVAELNYFGYQIQGVEPVLLQDEQVCFLHVPPEAELRVSSLDGGSGYMPANWKV
jgi:hypothetical protein